MVTTWKPVPGQVALIELADAATECITGVVVDDHGEGPVVVDLGASPRPPAAPCEVVASIFAPDALYRLTATATNHAGTPSMLDLTVHEVQRVQRRTSPRAKVALPAALSNLDDPGAFSSITGITVDVGPGGCRIRTQQRWPPGGDPTVTLTLPGEEQVIGLAAVLQAEPAGDGWEYRLVFLDLGDDDRKRLSELVT